MNSAKITQHSLEDIETALILLQMATGLPTDEIEEKFKSSEEIQNRIEKKSKPKRRAAVKCVAMMRSLNDEITPARKRGRPALNKIVASAQPAKKPKIVPVEEKEEMAALAPALSNVTNQITATPLSSKRNSKKIDDAAKWRTMRLNMMKEGSARASREREVLQMLRLFFKSQPVNSYQPEFFQKFIRHA